MALVASVRPNSVIAETAIVSGTTVTLRMRLRLSMSTRGRIASRTVRRGQLVSVGRRRHRTGAMHTCLPFVLLDRSIVDSRSFAAEHALRHAALVQMRSEGASATLSFSNVEEETFKSTNEEPLLAAIRLSTAAVDEREGCQRCLLAAERNGERLRGDARHCWVTRPPFSAATRNWQKKRAQEKSTWDTADKRNAAILSRRRLAAPGACAGDGTPAAFGCCSRQPAGG